MPYKINVDRNLCIGAATCVALAPKTFVLDNEAKAIILPPPNDEDKTILEAAKSCPTNAIIVIDEATGQQVWPVKDSNG